MEQNDVDKLGAEVAKLDLQNDAHWNSQGHPNCNYLREVCGFQVAGSTLLSHGLMRDRGSELAKLNPANPPAQDPAAPAAPPELQDPGAAPAALDTQVPEREKPLEGDTWDTNTTLHRNRHAMGVLLKNAKESQDILARMTRKSAVAVTTEKALLEFTKELERILEQLR